ncbi:transposase [Dactylosporangium cerinum]|uniref:Transposase n=1 Tax=Dactylosporangium cerinum TaxID=1434730 RepID=A0ABV9WGK6_9ACTN
MTQQQDGAAFAVFCGLDVAKTDHRVVALRSDGGRLADRTPPNDETALTALFTELVQSAGGVDRVLVVVDQPASIGALPVAVARAQGLPVAHLPYVVAQPLSVPIGQITQRPQQPVHQAGGHYSGLREEFGSHGLGCLRVLVFDVHREVIAKPVVGVATDLESQVRGSLGWNVMPA